MPDRGAVCRELLTARLPAIPIYPPLPPVQTTITGNYPGNTGYIVSNTSLCNSIVYVVDMVRPAAWCGLDC